MDSHEREYAAAVIGMADIYGSPAQPIGTRCVAGRVVNLYAVGDAVMFTGIDGTARMGRIEEAANDDLYVIGTEEGRVVVHADAIYPF
jgi:hypothetical protein